MTPEDTIDHGIADLVRDVVRFAPRAPRRITFADYAAYRMQMHPKRLGESASERNAAPPCPTPAWPQNAPRAVPESRLAVLLPDVDWT